MSFTGFLKELFSENEPPKNNQNNQSDQNKSMKTITWQVPPLCAEFTTEQLNTMDDGIWEFISLKMMHDHDFLIHFEDKINWSAIQSHCQDTPPSGEFVEMFHKKLDLSKINKENLTQEFIQKHENWSFFIWEFLISFAYGTTHNLS